MDAAHHTPVLRRSGRFGGPYGVGPPPHSHPNGSGRWISPGSRQTMEDPVWLSASIYWLDTPAPKRPDTSPEPPSYSDAVTHHWSASAPYYVYPPPKLPPVLCGLLPANVGHQAGDALPHGTHVPAVQQTIEIGEIPPYAVSRSPPAASAPRRPAWPRAARLWTRRPAPASPRPA